MKAVTIKQRPEPEKQVPAEILAESIVAISEGIKKLRRGHLNDRALILLIQENCNARLSKENIKAVLDSIETLQAAFVRR